MTQLQAELKNLCEINPKLDPRQVEHHFHNLLRMETFYKDKAPSAPKYQGLLFKHFAESLIWATENLSKYNELTKELADLAEGTSVSDDDGLIDRVAENNVGHL